MPLTNTIMNLFFLLQDSKPKSNAITDFFRIILSLVFVFCFCMFVLYFLGSPLKSNNISALAYSPNQRNAFIRQQQYQQALQQQQQQINSNLTQQVSSPLFQGTQLSLGSSSPVKSPHIQQFLKVCYQSLFYGII